MSKTSSGMETPPSAPHALVQALDQGIVNHTAWLKNLHRNLVCGLPPNPNDVAIDAHCRCQFGRWYYETPHSAELLNHKLFKRLGNHHRDMHEQARKLLQKSAAGQHLDTSDYDSFIDLSISFNAELRKLQMELVSDQYAIDPLTHLATRQGMLLKLRREQERASRANKTCVICMMDLDHFKRINDTYGHQAGDQVLRTTAQFIAQSLRKYDQAFRYGGEEFLLFLPEIDTTSAQGILERIRLGLEKLRIALDNEQYVQITGSFGVSEVENDISVEEAISRADQALYAAKDAGRNRIVIWQEK